MNNGRRPYRENNRGFPQNPNNRFRNLKESNNGRPHRPSYQTERKQNAFDMTEMKDALAGGNGRKTITLDADRRGRPQICVICDSDREDDIYRMWQKGLEYIVGKDSIVLVKRCHDSWQGSRYAPVHILMPRSKFTDAYRELYPNDYWKLLNFQRKNYQRGLSDMQQYLSRCQYYNNDRIEIETIRESISQIAQRSNIQANDDGKEEQKTSTVRPEPPMKRSTMDVTIEVRMEADLLSVANANGLTFHRNRPSIYVKVPSLVSMHPPANESIKEILGARRKLERFWRRCLRNFEMRRKELFAIDVSVMNVSNEGQSDDNPMSDEVKSEEGSSVSIEPNTMAARIATKSVLDDHISKKLLQSGQTQYIAFDAKTNSAIMELFLHPLLYYFLYPDDKGQWFTAFRADTVDTEENMLRNAMIDWMGADVINAITPLYRSEMAIHNHNDANSEASVMAVVQMRRSDITFIYRNGTHLSYGKQRIAAKGDKEGVLLADDEYIQSIIFDPQQRSYLSVLTTRMLGYNTDFIRCDSMCNRLVIMSARPGYNIVGLRLAENSDQTYPNNISGIIECRTPNPTEEVVSMNEWLRRVDWDSFEDARVSSSISADGLKEEIELIKNGAIDVHFLGAMKHGTLLLFCVDCNLYWYDTGSRRGTHVNRMQTLVS